MPAGGRARRAVTVAAVLLLACAGARGQDEGVEYRWDARLDPEEALLEVEGAIRVRNDGEAPLSRLPLVLYGNRFQRVDPAITDITFDRFYVPYFDAGRMDLRGVRTPDGRALAVEPTSDDGVAVEVVLDPPVPPGGWVDLRVAATVHLPSRLGTFGHRGRRVVLEGGWHPWVPALDPHGARPARGAPALARHEVRLRVAGLDPDDVDEDDPERALVDGAPDEGLSVATVTTATTPSLIAGHDLARLAAAGPRGDAPGTSVWGEAGDEARADRILRVSEQACAFLRDHLPALPQVELVFVEAPLRDRFVHPTQGRVVLYSDRLFHVVRPLQTFHEMEVGRAAIEALVRAALADVRLGVDRDWLVEALGWYLTRAWVADGRAGGITSGTITGGLRFLDFIPAVDSLLRAPRFVGSELYYGRFYEPADAVPDELSRALTRRPRGRVVLEKLRDKLGDERLDALVRAALGREDVGPGPGLEPGGLAAASLRDRAARLLGRDLHAFFDLWVGARPAENLAIDGVDVLEELEDGGERVRVRIRRDGDTRPGEVGEPVVVEAEGKDGQPVRATWDGEGPRGEVELTRYGLVWKPIELDPDGRVEQAYRGDDRTPVIAKLLVNRFRVKVDFNNDNRNEAALGITLHPLYDYAHTVLVDAFYEQDERGLTLGYAYGFGAVIDERTYGTSVGGRVTVADLTTGVVKDEAELEETKGTLVSVGAGVSFDTRVFEANPTWGFGISFGYEHSDKAFGSDFRFDAFSGSIELVYSFVRGTQLGVEVLAGQLIGTDLPSQRLFDVGGEGGVRGVEASELLGKATFVIRTELRQMLVEDLDVPLLWVAWLRKLQAVAFIDTGDVADTLYDIVWDPVNDWKWGAGGGVRAWVDVFGVTRAILRFDVAVRLDPGREGLTPEFYFGAGQSF